MKYTLGIALAAVLGGIGPAHAQTPADPNPYNKPIGSGPGTAGPMRPQMVPPMPAERPKALPQKSLEDVQKNMDQK